MGSEVEEAERHVIVSAILTGGVALDEVTVTGRDFADPTTGDVFDVIRDLHANGKAITLATVDDVVSARIPTRRGWVFSLDTVDVIPSMVGTHAAIVAKNAYRRRLIDAGRVLTALPEFESIDETAAYVRSLIDNAGAVEPTKVRFLADIIPATIDRMQGDDQFIPTPWRGVNDMIGGLRPGCLYVVGARPGVGKTVFAQALATALAVEGVVAFSSLEMSGEELAQRFLADRAGVSIARMKNQRMEQADWEVLARNRSKAALPVAVDDRAGVGPEQVREFARAVGKTGTLAGVIVDYVQLMTASSKLRRVEQVAEFTRQLKILAKDMQVPVVALSQLNRESEAGGSRSRPRAAQLRESGTLEQDADTIMLLHRDEDDSGNLSMTEIHVDVTKNRHGPSGHVTLSWDGAHSRITDMPEWGRR